MRSIKALIVSAAFGFVLSFVFGLFSHAAILIVLLRALIIALVFAGLGFALSLVSDKFLFDDSEGSDIASEPVVSSNSAVGSQVDLYVHDEELSPGDSENNYYVDDNSRQMLNAADMHSARPVFSQPQVSPAEDVAAPPASSSEPAAANIEPLSEPAPKAAALAQENAQAASASVPASEMSSPAAAPASSQAASSQGANDSGLDTLPDMSSFVMENSSSSSEEDDNDSSVESDSHFATTVSHSSGSSDAGIQDAAVMAKAISSVLSSEDS